MRTVRNRFSRAAGETPPPTSRTPTSRTPSSRTPSSRTPSSRTPSSPPPLARLPLLLLGCFLTFGAIAPAVYAEPKTHVLLIGVEAYQYAPPLTFTINDVKRLAETLEERGGVWPSNIVQMTDDADPELQPTCENMQRQLVKFLESPRPEDMIIVYFSGHGFQDDQGRLYLAPIDCKPDAAADTAVAIGWIRDQLNRCQAASKLLLLDACHAGSEKGAPSTGIAADALGQPFAELKDVVTIASSKASEKSLIWGDRQQSLFSFWLNQGLRGHADDNSDQVVNIDELYQYVHQNVRVAARRNFKRDQTPVRIVHPGTPGVPAIVRLKPTTLRNLMDDIAEQLALAVEAEKAERVGVLEFTNTVGDQLGTRELLGANFGLLGKYCAEELEERLIKRSFGSFDVVDRDRLRNALNSLQFVVADFGRDEMLQQLSAKVKGMPLIMRGFLSEAPGRKISIRCKLTTTQESRTVASFGGVAYLNESEWAMLGRSVQVRADDRRVDPFATTVRRPVDQVIERIEERSRVEVHPLQDPNFRFPIKIMVNGRERPGRFIGGDYYVPLDRGEQYAVQIESRWNETAMLRLLVDGLNTLPEPARVDPDKAFAVEQAEYQVAARVNLDEARAWILDPSKRRVWTIPGFASATGAGGEWKTFRVVDAAASVAARDQFTDQIGLITAAFYAATGSTRSAVGTDFGETRRERINERKDQAVGNLLAVVHIRYVSSSEFQRLGSAGR